MGESNTTSGKANIDTESVVKGMVGVSRVHQNVTQELVVVTEDKIRICLSNYKDRIGSKRAWIAPLGILLTIIIAFPTTDFKEQFEIPASTWQAFFMFVGLASFIWLLTTTKAAFQSAKLDDVISDLKKESRDTVGSSASAELIIRQRVLQEMELEHAKQHLRRCLNDQRLLDTPYDDISLFAPPRRLWPGSPCQMSGYKCPVCKEGVMDVVDGEEGVKCNKCGLYIPARHNK